MVMRSCLVYCEGRRDKNFFQALKGVSQFKHHTKGWVFHIESGSGRSPETVLRQCRQFMGGRDFQLILCLIDVDALKTQHGDKWEERMKELNEKYPEIKIIWQYDCAEDEYRNVLTEKSGKNRINRLVLKNIKRFVNSPLWNRILAPIKERSIELRGAEAREKDT